MDSTTPRRDNTIRGRTGVGRKKDEELGKAKGEGTITAILDCSKCYERENHKDAFRRTLRSGCNPTKANLVMDLYQGARIIRVHGAISQVMRAKAGLIAGCAFAKDVLKAFLETIKQVTTAECRDYVDDITIIARGFKAEKVIPKFYEQLQQAKNWLRQNNMILNGKK